MTNKELEQLFKNKLDYRDLEFNPDAWARMEIMLDAHMPVAPWYQTTLTWVKGLTAATVVGLSFWFLTLNTEPQTAQYQPLNNNSELNKTDHNNNPSNNYTLFNYPSSFSKEGSNNANSAVADANSKNSNALNSTSGLSNTQTEVETNRILASNNKNRTNVLTLSREEIARKNNATTAENPFLISGIAPISVSEEKLWLSPKSKFSESDITTHIFKPKHYNKPFGEWRLGITLQAITAQSTDLNTEGTITPNNSNGFAVGLIIAKKLGSKWSLQSGLNYSMRSAKGAYAGQNIQYDFGLQSTQVMVNEKSKHSVELPLTVQYHFALRHQIKAGLYGAYLISTACNVNQEVNNGFDVQSNSKFLFINNTRQNQWDAGWTLGYAYSLNKDFELGISAWMGLTNVYSTSVTEQIYKNKMLRISLNYWL